MSLGRLLAFAATALALFAVLGRGPGPLPGGSGRPQRRASPPPAAAVTGPPRMPAYVAGPYAVLRVVDGDTVRVAVAGRSEPVRLIGVDTPETRDPRRPVQCYGPEASRTLGRLLAGRRVYLETDPTQARRDRYGRLLAYVWRAGPRPLLVEEALIAGGYGREYTYRASRYRYQARFRLLQQRARAARRGLWDPRACSRAPPG